MRYVDDICGKEHIHKQKVIPEHPSYGAAMLIQEKLTIGFPKGDVLNAFQNNVQLFKNMRIYWTKKQI